MLVAGGHRLAAAKLLKLEKIECFVVDEGDEHARLWEIAENLHREDLTRLERSEQITEWIKITENLQLSQIGSNETKRPDGRGHRKQSGVRQAARQLPLDGATEAARLHTAQRAVKIASLSNEAKQVARELTTQRS